MFGTKYEKSGYFPTHDMKRATHISLKKRNRS